MDMSFLIKSMLPPGVSMEMLQETGKEVINRILTAAQQIDANNQLLTEQNAMLRQLLDARQALSTPSYKETQDDHAQSHDDPLSPAEHASGGGDGSVIPNDGPGSNCNICESKFGEQCGIAADSGDCRNTNSGGEFVGNEC